MGAKENFSSSLQLETSESIRGDLSEAKNPVSLYKKALEVLGKMESNFDNALGKNPYDYFDGNVETDLDKTEFEKKAQELSTKAKELYEQMSIGSALYVLAQSKLGISSVEQQELDTLIQALLQTQETAKQQVESDLLKAKNLEFSSEIGVLKYSEIDEYNPETTPNKIPISKATQVFLNEKYSDRRNIEATDINKLSSWLTNFCEQNPQLLSELEIQDIYNLSPRKAIFLTSKIVQDRLSYSDDQTEELDNAPIDQLLEIDRKGICRNYSQIVKAIFDIFKSLQDPQTTQLANTYCKQMGSLDKDIYNQNSAEEHIVNNHRWNNFYTVLPSGDIKKVVMDVTWTDDGGSESYSKERFLFDLIDLVDKGLLSKEDQIAQLENIRSYGDLDKNSVEYKAISEYLDNYYKGIAEFQGLVKGYEKEIQGKYNIEDSKINNLAKHPEFFANISEFFYQKGDYKKAIEFGLKSMNHEYSFDTLIILVASCIKNGSEEWKDNHYSLDTFLNPPDWFTNYEDKYSNELRLIRDKYMNA